MDDQTDTSRAHDTFVLHDLGGHGSPILVCHATGFCGQAYVPLADRLASRHRVYAIDFRGHGDAPPPDDGDFAWANMATEIMAAAAQIGAEPAHLVGHSMGGAAALLAAATDPTKFASAYHFEPIVVSEPMLIPPGQNPMADGARRRTQRFGSKAAAYEKFASKPPLDELSEESMAAYVEHGLGLLPDGRAFLKCSGDSEAATYEATGQISTELIAQASQPTVIATGEPSISMLAALAPAIVDALPNAEHRLYPDLGHFGPLAAPDRIARDILEHIGAATSASTSS
jgi:pimeloyl-ACP methyl ester carboxylesterase